LFWSTVLGWYYQVLAAKLGVATQRNLAQNCREQFTPKSKYTLWIMTELAIIGSDMQEVVGSATAIAILTGWSLQVGAVITILDSFLFLFIHYYGVRKLEFFFLLLIGIMTVTFCANMITSEPNYGEIAIGLVVPRVPKGSLNAMLGLVGAVIMPHNLYLHSALVLSRKVNYRNRNAVAEGNYYNAVESAISLGVSFFINTFVIATFAVYVINNKDNAVDTDLNLTSAAAALEVNFGTPAKYIWAIGLLAAGQSSTMTGTYAG
jgi:natural resistance-associated macrophage protein 2